MKDVEAAIQQLSAELTLEEKVLLVTGRDFWSLQPLDSIGLRSIVVSDGPAGVRGPLWDERSPSVSFPSPTALAATWQRSTVRALGRALGGEARRKGVDVVLAPTINLHRTPYGGRHFEAFSEDPILTGELAGEYVRGIQDHGVGATLKHYVGNESETERFTVDVQVDERTLREAYLLAFELPIVDAKPWLVMSAYNSVNGATASENSLLTSPLNDEWHFDGVVVSDWTAVRSVESARHPQDLAMPGPGGAWGLGLLDAVRSGQIDEAAIDRKVHRILRLAARVGALKDLASEIVALPQTVSGRDVARHVAAEGSVLLQNTAILPLDSPSSIALIGEAATMPRTQGGGSATVVAEHVVSPLEGLRRRWPTASIEWAHGATVNVRPAPVPLDDMTDADGGPGMTVTYRTTDGGILLRENREAASIVVADVDLVADLAEIELSFRYRRAAGTSELAVIGACDFEVILGGHVVATGGSRTRPDDDPATALFTPPYSSFTIPEATSDTVVVRITPVPGTLVDPATFGIGIPASHAAAEDLIAEAAALAARQDVAVVVVSTSPEVESEGFDRTSLRLPGRQDDLVRAVIAANPRTIVVVNTGAPVVLPWRADAAAILAVWFPGQEFGHALADVLSGDVEPGGRLPVSWPDEEANVPVHTVTPTQGRLVYREGLDIGYRGWLRSGATPAFDFGHGLGYTSHEISSMRVDATTAREDVPVDVVVQNTGTRDGKVVVQFYLERVSPSLIERPVRWLAQFEAAEIAVGDTSTISTIIPWRRFAHWSGEWSVEPGEYRVVCALSVTGEGVSETVELS